MKIEITATPQEAADMVHLLEKETPRVTLYECARNALEELANSKESSVKI